MSRLFNNLADRLDGAESVCSDGPSSALRTWANASAQGGGLCFAAVRLWRCRDVCTCLAPVRSGFAMMGASRLARPRASWDDESCIVVERG